jgi:hypothetical protein
MTQPHQYALPLLKSASYNSTGMLLNDLLYDINILINCSYKLEIFQIPKVNSIITATIGQKGPSTRD